MCQCQSLTAKRGSNKSQLLDVKVLEEALLPHLSLEQLIFASQGSFLRSTSKFSRLTSFLGLTWPLLAIVVKFGVVGADKKKM
jgi:hypothetical protein